MTVEDPVARTARRDAAELTTLDAYLEEEGLKETLQAVAITEVIAFQLDQTMASEG